MTLYFGRDWLKLINDLEGEMINKKYCDFAYSAQTVDSKIYEMINSNEVNQELLGDCVSRLEPIKFQLLKFLNERQPILEHIEEMSDDDYEKEAKSLKQKFDAFKESITNQVSEIFSTFQSPRRPSPFPENQPTKMDLKTQQTTIATQISSFLSIVFMALELRESLDLFIDSYKKAYTPLEMDRQRAMEIQKLQKKLEIVKIQRENILLQGSRERKEAYVEAGRIAGQEGQEGQEIGMTESYVQHPQEYTEAKEAFVAEKVETLPSKADSESKRITIEMNLNEYKNSMRMNNIISPDKAVSQKDLGELWHKSPASVHDILRKMVDKRWLKGMKRGKEKLWYLID